MKCACFVETCFHHLYRLCVVFAGSIHIISMYTYDVLAKMLKKKSSTWMKKKIINKNILFLFTYYYYYYYFFFFNVCNQYLPELQYKAKSKCEVEFVFFYMLSFNTCVVFCYYVGTHVTKAILNNFLTYTYLLYIHLPLAQ